MNKLLAKTATAITTAGCTILNIAFAANQQNITNKLSGLNMNSSGNIEDLIIKIINYALAVSGLVAVIFLVMGGFQYVTAQGNEDSVKKATKTIVNAIIGLIIIFSAYAIINTVQGFIGTNANAPANIS